MAGSKRWLRIVVEQIEDEDRSALYEQVDGIFRAAGVSQSDCGFRRNIMPNAEWRCLPLRTLMKSVIKYVVYRLCMTSEALNQSPICLRTPHP
jgi:hypothetical protein